MGTFLCVERGSTGGVGCLTGERWLFNWRTLGAQQGRTGR